MVNSMFQSLSDAQLAEGFSKYTSSPSIMADLKAEQERRVEAQSQAMEALGVLAQEEAARLKLEAGITKLANKLPKPVELPGVKAIVFVAQEVEDTSQPAEEVEIIDKDGAGAVIGKHTETRFPKVVSWVYVPNACWARKPEGKLASHSGGKRKVKKVYRMEDKGPPTPIISSEPIATWQDWGRWLNEHPEYLRRNAEGQPIEVIDTKASGLVDLKTAGFIGVEES